jgi:predicted RNase H-like nuclease (RuvC/YqgF family)
LRKKLSEAKYLCDDSSTGRGINNVIMENKGLQKKLKEYKEVIDNLNTDIQNLQN